MSKNNSYVPIKYRLDNIKQSEIDIGANNKQENIKTTELQNRVNCLEQEKQQLLEKVQYLQDIIHKKKSKTILKKEKQMLKQEKISKLKTYFAISTDLKVIKIGKSKYPERETKIKSLSYFFFEQSKEHKEFQLIGYIDYNIEIPLHKILRPYIYCGNEFYKNDPFVLKLIRTLISKYKGYNYK